MDVLVGSTPENQILHHTPFNTCVHLLQTLHWHVAGHQICMSHDSQPMPGALLSCSTVREMLMQVAVHDLSLGIPTGERFGFLGENGAGKVRNTLTSSHQCMQLLLHV